MTLRYGSVCSGIEAASAAWHPLGWTPEFFAEIERFPSEVLAHHYGSNLPGEELSRNGVPNYGDMTKFQEWPDHGEGSDKSIDILVGGTPCQSFSVAGLRKGLADPRGNLALTYLAIADRYRPKWVVWENVPGVLSSWSGDQPPSDLVEGQEWEAGETSDFGCFLAGLSELGYGWAYRVLDAQHVRVDGFGRAVPQRRRRVFVVGCLGDWRRAGAVLFERESLLGNPAPRREAREGVAGHAGERAAFGGGNTGGAIDAAACLTAKGQRIDFEVETFVATREVAATLTRGAESGGSGGYAGRRQEDDDNLVASVAGTLKASSGRRNMVGVEEASEGLLVAHTLRAEGFDASEDGTGRGIPLVPVCFNSREDPKVTFDRSGPLGASPPQAQAIAFAMQERMESLNPDNGPHGKGWSDEGCAFTLEARHRTQSIAHGWAVRRLTPTECERLQGFPDGYTAIPRNGKPAADGPRYKALGNSMAVNVMRWIGRRIEAVEKMEAELQQGRAA